MKFCPLCYGSIKPIEDARYECKRCGSTFDTMGELIFRRNEHIAPEVAAAIDAGALPLETVDGEVSALCGTCGERITKDALTGTSCLCSRLDAIHRQVFGKPYDGPIQPCDAVSITFKRCTDDGSLVSPQGHRLAYGGVPGCWRVKPEDFPASDGSGSYEAT